MRDFYKLFYELDDKQRQQMYEKRQTYESTISLDLSIKPIRQDKTFALYYIPTNFNLQITSQIYKYSWKISDLTKLLPDFAQEQYSFTKIIDEIYYSNVLEGVKCTRHEILESFKEVMFSSKNQRKRFSSMVESYFGLLKNNFEIPTTPEDIRAIYDEITKGEIAEAELPDGEIFRKDVTHILKKSGSGKVIHRGITPEKSIKDHIVK